MNTIIIHGGGNSITEIIPLNLWRHLQDLYILGVNFSFRDLVPTTLISCDYKFYAGLINPPKNGLNPKFYEELKQLPLIIIPNREDMVNIKLDNTIIQDHIPDLCLNSGLYATYLATLLNPQEIYLLGFDFNKIGQNTHYYNHTKHRGLGNVSINFYRKINPNHWFEKINYNNIKVYNVSMESKLTIFPKITPQNFINKIKELPKLNQEALRTEIKSKLIFPAGNHRI